MKIAMQLAFCCLLTLFQTPTLLAEESFEAAVEDLSRQILNSLESRNRPSVAVADFTDLDGEVSPLGQFLAEELTTRIFMASAGQFDVVERHQLQRELTEQSLSLSGRLAKDSLARIGEALGIGAIVTGSVADLGKEIKINARLISVESTKVFAVAAVRSPKDETIADLITQAGQVGEKPEPVSAHTGKNASKVPETVASFQSPFLKISESAIRLTEDYRRIKLTLTFENTTDRTLFVAFERNTAILADEKGNILKIRAIQGLEYVPSYQAGDQDNYSVLSPGVSYPVGLTFESRTNIEGSIFSLSASLFRFEHGKVEEFTAALGNMKIGR